MKRMPPSHRHIKRRRRKKGETDQLAAQLAPLEEQDKPAAEQQIGSAISTARPASRDPGAIIVDNADLKVANDIIETKNEHQLGIEPVVLVVLVILLSFIGFITWQISLMPAR